MEIFSTLFSVILEMMSRPMELFGFQVSFFSIMGFCLLGGIVAYVLREVFDFG